METALRPGRKRTTGPSRSPSAPRDILSGRLTAVGDLALTERWIAQGRFEVNAAGHDVSRYGTARGGNDIELGLRLRFETAGGIAPYLGVSWIQTLGETADLVRDAGDDPYTLGAVAGLRFAF